MERIFTGPLLYYQFFCVFLFFSLVLNRNVLNQDKEHKGILWVVRTRPLLPEETCIRKKVKTFKFYLKRGNYLSSTPTQLAACQNPTPPWLLLLPAYFSQSQTVKRYPSFNRSFLYLQRESLFMFTWRLITCD